MMILVMICLSVPSALVTAIICERLLRRGKRVSVWVAVVTAFAMAPVMMFALGILTAGWSAFTVGFWDDVKTGFDVLLFVWAIFVIFALPFSAGVVWLYQRRAVMIRR